MSPESQLEFPLDFTSHRALKTSAVQLDQLLRWRYEAIRSGKRRQLAEILFWIEQAVGSKSTPAQLEAEAASLIKDLKAETSRVKKAQAAVDKAKAKEQASIDNLTRIEREGAEYRARLAA